MRILDAKTLLMLTLAPFAVAAPCNTAPLTTYLNSGSFFSCTQNAGALTYLFNHDILPSYVGVDLLPANNSSANPASITVIPGSPGLSFTGNFSSGGPLLSSQAELVHFLTISDAAPLSATTFSFSGATTGSGALGGGAGLVIGQEIVCIGGTFTSLPTGLVTTVANGVLANGTFGCTGVAAVGTAAVSSGPLNAITGTLALPNLTGLTDTALISFGSARNVVDVIKLQALVTAATGTASTTGFGDGFSFAPVPEPGTLVSCLAGLALLALHKRRTNGI